MDPQLVDARQSFDAIAPQAPSMARELRRKGLSDGRMRWLPCFPAKPVSGICTTTSSSRPFELAYFGRLAPHKGLDLLIKAIAAERIGNELHLDIWGTGEASHYRTMAATLFGVDGNPIRFLGAYPSAREGAELMASYDALALTSTGNEGLPLVLLEAMSYGLPLMTTSVAAIPDCCEGNEDTVMVQPTIEGVQTGLRQLVARLDEGSFSPRRQQKFYERHFSHAAMSWRWLECLTDPWQFFAQHE